MSTPPAASATGSNGWPGKIRRELGRLVFQANTLALRPAALASRNQFLFVLAHMRSGSSLLRYLLSGSEEIIGIGETHNNYRRRSDLPERCRRFAFVGSLVRHKGVHVLLEAFRAMPDDATLDVHGPLHYDPAYTEALRRLAAHPGMRFAGAAAPECVPRLLAGVDGLVVPSIWQENSPLTVHEGFLAGVPVVASRLGGHAELLAGGGGLLYEADDPTDLAAKLRRCSRSASKSSCRTCGSPAAPRARSGGACTSSAPCSR